jgi:formylglycine-generating enzyme required for sulfatase activity
MTSRLGALRPLEVTRWGELLFIALIFLSSCLWEDTLYVREESITIEAFATDTTGVEDCACSECLPGKLETIKIIFGNTITFIGIIQGDSSLVELNWDFGDGNNANKAIAEHSYDRHGVYNAVFTITDKAEFSLSDTVTVLIKEKNMVFIPGGTFQMGSNTGYYDNERPVHTVTLSSFWMDTVEVTQGEYSSLMRNAYPDSSKGYSNPEWDYGQGDNYPAYRANWYDAVLFCNVRSKREGLDTVYSFTSLQGSPGNKCELNDVTINLSRDGYRLPTEAEWEYACRAGTLTEYYWGDSINGDYAWYKGNSEESSHPVGEKLPNRWGLYDMSGNVHELVNDWYYRNYDISEPEPNPTGPASGSFRVLRGGGHSSAPYWLRSAYRNGDVLPESTHYCYGFRCVRNFKK